MKNGLLTGGIKVLSIGTIIPETFRCAFDTDVKSFQENIQALLNQWKAKENKDIGSGFKLPEIFGVKGDIDVLYTNGYTEIGITATPATFEGIGEIIASAFEKAKYARKLEKISALEA